MFSTRSYALAAALLLVPTGYAWAGEVQDALGGFWSDPDDYVGYSGRVAGWVENVTFADPPRRAVFPPWELIPEEVVEGHTTFVTIQRTAKAVEQDGHLNITGFVSCTYGVDANHSFAAGAVPVPRRVNRAWVDCGHGTRVVVSPGLAATSSAGPMTPTGRLVPVETPSGERGFAEEFVFAVTEEAWDGTLVSHDRYAWATPVFPAWVHHDGTVKNFWMPLPLDRLEAMGIREFDITLEPTLR